MSPRKHKRQTGGKEVAGAWSYGVQSTQDEPDGEWYVRTILAAAATKAYRCPGCDQVIPPGTAHLVAWQADVGSAEDRRHWHRPCWNARLRRRPRG